ATILFDPNIPHPLGEQATPIADGSSYWNNKEYYKTQQWIIQSRRLAAQVVRDLELNKDADFMANAPGTHKRAGAHFSVEQAADVLIRRLGVEQIKDSRLTTIKLRDA